MVYSIDNRVASESLSDSKIIFAYKNIGLDRPLASSEPTLPFKLS